MTIVIVSPLFHYPCFTTVSQLLAIYWLPVDSWPAVGQQYLLGTVLHFHPVTEDQSRKSEDLGFNTSWETHSFSLYNAHEKSNCIFFWVNTSLQSIFIYPTQKFMIIWENYSSNKSSIQEKILYLVSKCKRLLYYHAYLVFYWKNTVCKLS